MTSPTIPVLLCKGGSIDIGRAHVVTVVARGKSACEVETITGHVYQVAEPAQAIVKRLAEG